MFLSASASSEYFISPSKLFVSWSVNFNSFSPKIISMGLSSIYFFSVGLLTGHRSNFCP